MDICPSRPSRTHDERPRKTVQTTQGSRARTAHTFRMAPFREQRVEPRESLALPLQLRDGSRAVTRDISASGLYFEIPGLHQVDGFVDFEMQLEEAGMKFTAVGRIVRLEHRQGRTGIAVELLAPRLESTK